MYCGTAVKGCPVKMSKTDVVFRYYQNDEAFSSSMMSTDELSEQQRKALDDREIGKLHLYPFDRGELGKLLVDCGFQDITVYRDLDWEKPYSFAGGEWFDEETDFFVYVATKPADG